MAKQYGLAHPENTIKALNAGTRSMAEARAELRKRKDQLTDVDAKLDRAMGRVVTWSNKMADLRAKRKRILRELAKAIAA